MSKMQWHQPLLATKIRRPVMGDHIVKNTLAVILALSALGTGATQAAAQDDPAPGSSDLDTVSIKSASGDTLSLQQKSTQTKALEITDGIYQATGFGNSFLVVTDAGNVVIDTSLPQNAAGHKKLLDAVSNKVPEYIIATHGHGDHVGGIALWRGTDTQVIAQENSVEFLHYQTRLAGFFALRNSAQFGLDIARPDAGTAHPGNYDADIPATILFDDKYEFRLGGLTFVVSAAPAETLDALTVWIPEKNTVFVGDLIYESFPNIYTLRGTKPRWALDYVQSIDDVLALDAEIMIPSHGEAIKGADAVRAALTRYRDAILYVHDATVAGMNAGKDVHSLMEEIQLPAELALPEQYGTVKWTVRGIYDGYAGWFDGNPSSILSIKPSASNISLVKMAGGLDAVVAEAEALFGKGEDLSALSLAESVLSVEPKHKPAWAVRLRILQKLHKNSANFNEAGWLGYGIRQSKKAIEE